MRCTMRIASWGPGPSSPTSMASSRASSSSARSKANPHSSVTILHRMVLQPLRPDFPSTFARYTLLHLSYPRSPRGTREEPTMATLTSAALGQLSEQEYKRRIRAWTMYDWANSAFATTILAAVLPIYYSQVAGATLPSPAIATAYWARGLSISLFITALLSPILGTISDVMRGKKRFLSIFVGMGTLATGLLVLVERGDWLLASILFIFGRVGFTAANVFYDALLPHVARESDRDRVSTRGYAMGYLGGGLLLAINVVMIQMLPGTWGPRFSFLSVAIWWAVFSIPLFRRVPEPPAATAKLSPGENVVSVSFKRLWETLRDIRQYRELFKYLLAFLIYNDGIGTIIGVAAIYGAELGFGSTELVLALLLVQFVGIPFSLIFGRLPSKDERRRPFHLAFILYNLVALPLVGVLGAHLLPASLTSNLGAIIGMIVAVEALGLGLAWLVGESLFSGLANTMDTKRSILLALLVYAVIAVWGYFLNTVIEFWFLAWMVAVVQGGSQALSRSLYASMSPAAKSGEFFGLFGIMEKFSAIFGPLIFSAAVAAFGSSRPAVLSIIAFFVVGGLLLITVNVEEGRRVAHAEDQAFLQANAQASP
ncbi:MAG TPA: MFS transporter [Chloroflexi bacterium]|nr:MFS transporter [Chloroflexota bacterium]